MTSNFIITLNRGSKKKEHTEFLTNPPPPPRISYRKTSGNKWNNLTFEFECKKKFKRKKIIIINMQ